ncbi:MAG: Rieske 2Fe-2S domain-containing protein [Cyanobacteria bacterium]|nr:Rieske 2Fe-2S domain-containing protein [Cyanobacteriota bacterium]
MDRRLFLKWILGIPVLGSLALFVSPLLSYLRPSLGPITDTRINTKAKSWTEWYGEGGVFTQPDQATREREITFPLSAFPTPWSNQTFLFGQKSKEYTFQHFQTTRIPGFVVRLPEDVAGKPDFIVVSRICPHMGCVFNFVEPKECAAGYNYASAKNPHFACPCHLSVYDPLQKQLVGSVELRGKVVSGPAPRPPRAFKWEIRGDQLLITEAESGGIS